MPSRKMTLPATTGTNIVGHIHLRLMDGTEVELPRVRLGDDKKKARVITDFTGQPPCQRCGGHPGESGIIEGGLIEVRRRSEDGRWSGWVGACECVYGAWRHVPRRDPEPFGGRYPAIQWADDLADIPRGLGNDDWNWIRVAARPGETWQEVSAKLERWDIPPGQLARIRCAIGEME